MSRKSIFQKAIALLLGGAMIFATACGGEQTKKPKPSVETEIANTDILLCENGQTDYTIVLPTERTPAIEYMAEEVSLFLYESTGARLKIETDQNSYTSESKVISVGQTSVLQSSDVTATFAELGRDGFKIVRRDNNVIICGGADFGTVYGCYEFLTQEIGFEPYSNDEIYYEKHDVLKVKDFNITDIPDIGMRTTNGVFQYEVESGFRLRVLTDYYFMPENMNNGASSDWIPAADHTIKKIVTFSEYGAEHPEWFVDGDSMAGQCCLTNDSFVEAFIHETKELIQSMPNGRIVSITQNDGAHWCPCEKCKNEQRAYNFSGYFVRFCNKIINGFSYEKDGEIVEVEGVQPWVEKNCPERDIIYTTFAYVDTLKPPTTDEGELLDESCIPADRLYIRFAAFCCYYHPITDAECAKNISTAAYLEYWQKISNNRLLVWDYAADFGNYMMFFNDIYALKANLQLYKEIGAIHVYHQTAAGTNVYPFANLRLYLYAKLAWNVNLNTKELVDDFIKNYYKEAAPYVSEYLDLLLSYWAAKDEEKGHGFHAININSYPISDWSRSLVDQGLSLLEKGLEVCQKIDDKAMAEKLSKRVSCEMLFLSTLKLLNYTEYGYDENDYKAYVTYYKELANFTGVVGYKEFYSMADFLKKY